MMMRKSTRTWATSFTTASTNNIESSDAPHSSPIVVNRVQKEADIYIYTINDSDESSISSMEDSICSKKEEDNKEDVVDWERLERYIEQEDEIEDCFAYALDMGVLIQSRSRSSDDDDDCYSNDCQGGDLLDGEKQTTGKKRPPKFVSDGIVCGGSSEQMRVRCPAA